MNAPVDNALYANKAKELWDGMDANEQAGVRFGLFPYAKMIQAEKEGYNGRQLTVALMEHASANGGMRA